MKSKSDCIFINHIPLPSGLTPPALQALCKLVTTSEAGEQLIHKVLLCCIVMTHLLRPVVEEMHTIKYQDKQYQINKYSNTLQVKVLYLELYLGQSSDVSSAK